uniref:Uncharacterized protein n=1 Tax=Canis lupus dingo TaxID=286419 RepID=A0A8C0K6J5_CANLU
GSGKRWAKWVDVATLHREFCNTAYSASLAILTKAERFPLKVPTMYSTGRLMLKMQSGVVWCYFKQKVPLWSFVQYCSI